MANQNLEVKFEKTFDVGDFKTYTSTKINGVYARITYRFRGYHIDIYNENIQFGPRAQNNAKTLKEAKSVAVTMMKEEM